MPAHSRDRERALRRKASRQGGYFTAAEALECGYGYRLQHFHRARGNWEQVGRAIYRFPDVADTANEDLVRWSLWSRNRKGESQAVVSHDSALSIHGLSDTMPAKVHLTVPAGFRKRPPRGCILHRGSLQHGEVESREGYMITTPLKTLLDVSASDLSVEHLTSAIHDALSRGLVRRGPLVEAAEKSEGGRKILRLLALGNERVP